ncbi:MAG: hypothetical protein QNK85_08095 [Crocinitomicaceae bacterium]
MIDITRLVLDFGLFILIWMTQLIVYPSFLFYPAKEILAWHERYTKAIAIIVFPLMLGQLSITIFQVFITQNIYTFTSTLLVVFLWVITLSKFAPIHKQISLGKSSRKLLTNLIQGNWVRTVSWTLLFIMSAISVFMDRY